MTFSPQLKGGASSAFNDRVISEKFGILSATPMWSSNATIFWECAEYKGEHCAAVDTLSNGIDQALSQSYAQDPDEGGPNLEDVAWTDSMLSFMGLQVPIFKSAQSHSAQNLPVWPAASFEA